MSKLIFAIVLILGLSSAQANKTPSTRMLEYLRVFQQHPRKVSQAELTDLLFKLCGPNKLRSEVQREELPMLYPMEYLSHVAEVRCGEFVLENGKVVEGDYPEAGMFADPPICTMTQASYEIVLKVNAPFLALAGRVVQGKAL